MCVTLDLRVRRSSLLPFVAGFVMAAVGIASGQGTQPKADFPFASSAEIEAASVRASASTTAVARLLPDGVYQYFVAKRNQQGLAEIHGQLDDVTFIRSGRGVLRTGQTLAGQRETAPGEWRGDGVQDPVERPIGAGDLVVL